MRRDRSGGRAAAACLGALLGAVPAAAAAPTPEIAGIDREAVSLDERPAAADLDARGGGRGPRTALVVGAPVRLFGGVAIGRGLRFNNPYRLQTELGDSAESLSLTATYADLSLGVAASAGRFSHGGAVHASLALEGVAQQVLTPSYVVLYRLAPRFELAGRAGLPVVVTPDSNVGVEVALGGLYAATAALGVTVALAGSLFHGAATLETSRTAIPILSLELGLRYEYEVLP